MGMSSNHTTLDGLSVKAFFDNLAALAAGKPLAVVPFTDRRLLVARSPPLVSFPHPELVPLDHLAAAANFLDTATAKLLEFKLFPLTAADINRLKAEAATPSATSFNAVTAHVWRCKVLAAGNHASDKHINNNDDDNPTTILYAVDIRPRLTPPLPAAYAGNAIITGYGTATRKELAEAPLGRLVEAVREGSKRVNDEYTRSVIDWGELHKGVPRGDVLLSSWWKLGLNEVDFPWGRAAYVCPVMPPTDDIVLFLPGAGDNQGGVNVVVGLPKEDLGTFEDVFNKYLA